MAILPLTLIPQAARLLDTELRLLPLTPRALRAPAVPLPLFTLATYGPSSYFRLLGTDHRLLPLTPRALRAPAVPLPVVTLAAFPGSAMLPAPHWQLGLASICALGGVGRDTYCQARPGLASSLHQLRPHWSSSALTELSGRGTC
eukprot:1137833-Pelagomonas_calceolata.AAC.4